MSKLTRLLMEHFLWSISVADNSWDELSDAERLIFEDEETFEVVLK